MTSFSTLGSELTERIPQFTRASSVQVGKSRCLVKSRLNGRKLGVFYFDKYNYYADHPLPPLPQFPTPAESIVIDDYFKNSYIVQTNGHIGIDPVLREVDLIYDQTVIGTPNVDLYKLTNAQLVALFSATQSLPPNKNVYFCVPNALQIPVETGGSIAGLGIQYSQASLYRIFYRLRSHEFVRVSDLMTIGVSGTYTTENDTFMMRTNSVGNITNLTQKYVCFLPTFFNPTGQGVPIRYELLVPQGDPAPKLQVRLVKDRYDIDTINGGFFTRRYQEFTDNEWDTKVATDA